MSHGHDKALAQDIIEAYKWGYRDGRNDGFNHAESLIRKLHKPINGGSPLDYCQKCHRGWPCATIRALDGEPA